MRVFKVDTRRRRKAQTRYLQDLDRVVESLKGKRRAIHKDFFGARNEIEVINVGESREIAAPVLDQGRVGWELGRISKPNRIYGTSMTASAR